MEKLKNPCLACSRKDGERYFEDCVKLYGYLHGIELDIGNIKENNFNSPLASFFE